MALEDGSLTSPESRFPRWQRELEAAVVETDPVKLRRRIEAAEAAIFLRSQELVHSADGQAERQAISDAIRTLRMLQTEKLQYPDWNKE